MRICRILPIAMFASVVYGQLTQLDLRMQSRDVDFSGASATKPFKSGAGLPSSCGPGEMYYRTDATAGRNVYGCTASNSWTLEQGPPAASMASQLGDFAVTATSATTLAIGAGCSTSTPCTVRFGALVYSFGSGASVTISAGSGLAFIYISSAGALTVGHNVTASCSGSCIAQSGVTAFPGGCHSSLYLVRNQWIVEFKRRNRSAGVPEFEERNGRSGDHEHRDFRQDAVERGYVGDRAAHGGARDIQHRLHHGIMGHGRIVLLFVHRYQCVAARGVVVILSDAKLMWFVIAAIPCQANTSIVSIEPTQMQAKITVETDQAGVCTYRASRGAAFSSKSRI